MQPHYEPALREIEEFRRYFKRFPPLTVEHAYDFMFLEDDWQHGVKRGAWRRSGVYLIYADDGTLMYVGKATATFNKRIKQHAGKLGACELAVIPFPDGWVCFAPALEAFLISRLQPAENTCGMGEYIPRSLSECNENG